MKQVLGISLLVAFSSAVSFYAGRQSVDAGEKNVSANAENAEPLVNVVRGERECEPADLDMPVRRQELADVGAASNEAVVPRDTGNTNADAEKNQTDTRAATRRAEEIAERNIDRFKAMLDESASAGQTPLNAMVAEFESEQVDYAWAVDREEKIFKTFDQNERLNQISPTEIECKSKSCKVVVAVESQQQAESLATDFTLASSTGDTPVSIAHFISTDTGELTFFIADGQNMSQQER